MTTSKFTSSLSEHDLTNIIKHRSQGTTKRVSARSAKLPPIWGSPKDSDECEITTWCTEKECCELLDCGNGKWSIMCWPKESGGAAR